MIRIDYTEINRIIEILSEAKNITYDCENMIYYADGVELREEFIHDTCTKFSHYINCVHNALTKSRNILSKELNNDEVKKILLKERSNEHAPKKTSRGRRSKTTKTKGTV